MADRKCSPPIPLHVTPPPDSDARREAHIREAVAKIPAPPFASSDRVLLEHVANRIYAIEIDLVHIRVGNQRAEDHNQQAHVLLAGRIDDLDSTIAGLGRHVEARDSVSNEVQLEQAEKIDSARRVATEAKAAASGCACRRRRTQTARVAGAVGPARQDWHHRRCCHRSTRDHRAPVRTGRRDRPGLENVWRTLT